MLCGKDLAARYSVFKELFLQGIVWSGLGVESREIEMLVVPGWNESS
jgi:hypothetical protein